MGSRRGRWREEERDGEDRGRGGGREGRGRRREMEREGRRGGREVRRFEEGKETYASHSKLTPVLLPSPLGFHGHFSVFTHQHCFHIQPSVACMIDHYAS